MSGSRYYFFAQDGTVVHTAEMGNGWGSSPIIWSLLCRQYLGLRYWKQADINRLLEPAQNARLTDDHRFLLHLSCDRALVLREDFLQAGDIIERALLVTDGGVNHWPEVVALLRLHAADESVFGMGFYPTSVADDWWQRRNPETDDKEWIDVRKEAFIVKVSA